MWFVLCEPNDIPALAVYRALKSRGSAAVEVVTPELLSYSLTIEHRVCTSATSVDIRLGDGRRISDETVTGVLNRIYSVPVHLWSRSPAADRDYVRQELTALYLSWLYGLKCPVLNRPTPQGLSGRWRTESEWVALAHQAGLPTPVFRQSSRDGVDELQGQRRLLRPGSVRDSVVVVGDAAFGRLSDRFGDACCRLASLSETALLGVDLVASPGGWLFAGATPNPDLRMGGAPLVDALAEAFTSGALVR